MLSDLLDEILQKRLLVPAFQPIIDLREGTIYGYEALIRGPSNSPLHSPATLFEVAERSGRLLDLDLLCREIHIRAFARLQLPGRLFLNVNPATLLQPGFPPGVTRRFLRQQGVGPERLVIELTEQAPIEDYDVVRQALAHYREMGFAVGIDDVGAGYSGLRLWSELRPDFVKLDRHFIQGIHEDSCKRQFVYSIQEIAGSLGCITVAEGIETADEFQVVQSLGVCFGQGYHFGRPCATPHCELPKSLFYMRRANGAPSAGRTETVGVLARSVPTISPTLTVDEVGEIFAGASHLMSLPVLDEDAPVGMVRRYDFMNLYAGRFGRDLYGREAIRHFMDGAPLVIEEDLPVEKVSSLITNQGEIFRGDEFIITSKGRYVGVGTLIDLLRKITELQIRNARYANPLTMLPGNVPINEQIERLLRSGTPFAACYCDIDHFKSLNDAYGYGRGDLVIRTLAGVLTECVDPEIDFVGHIGGDDFMLILQSENWREICESILERFAADVPAFYDLEHRSAGGIWAEDRSGKRLFHPMLSLSIGAVRPKAAQAQSCHDVAVMASEAKKMAKKQAGNALFVERREFNADRALPSLRNPYDAPTQPECRSFI